MVKKKVDSRVKLVVENAIRRRHRSFIVLVGDRGRDQVVNLHYMLSKARVKTRPSVLWCYKKDLGFSTHRKKRMRQVKKLISRGLYDPDKENPFDLFVSSTDIRYCYYKDSHKVLGSTYGMVVLQDFAALTPNLLCRVIETVEGGGLIVLLLQTMTSLKQLYTMTMDVHSRFRTESYADVVPRFNERFILSLSSCATCLVCDDELNVLTISSTSHGITKDLTGGADGEDEDGDVGAAVETIDAQLEELQATLKEQHADEPVARLVGKCLTHDQARAVMTFTEALQEKSLRGTVALTAARGRGKSAALGFAIAGAIAHGYANIFVTAPSPENLGTMWEFVVRGLEALDYVDHTDYEIVKSTNKELSHCVVRLNVFRTHRQTVQYVRPQDASSIAAHAELVCIDEAAAIPLPIVRGLLGPFLVFLTSTVTGYEGTGRALSLKLIKQLRPGRKKVSKAKGKKKRREESNVHSGRTLKEITLRHPIRYAAGDPVEAWLHKLLCLDATNPEHALVTHIAGPGSAPKEDLRYRITAGLPHPRECELYYVDRDALFSFHALAEKLLQRIVALFVASHYKNSPNDLQLLADSPSHRLFVLLGPMRETAAGRLPDILCVAQLALEGEISRESVKAAMTRGRNASGDLIPWAISQQFMESSFAQLSGARIVRIATHPDAMRMGYGSRMLHLISEFFQGNITSLDGGSAKMNAEEEEEEEDSSAAEEGGGEKPKKLPALLVPVQDRTPEKLHWLGTSFGMTQSLFNYWTKASYRPLYCRQTVNPITGEHTVIMLRELENASHASGAPVRSWLPSLVSDFRARFRALLAYQFRSLTTELSLSVIDPRATSKKGGLNAQEMRALFTPHDVDRLEKYSRNLVDYHLVLDLMPRLARLVFEHRFPTVKLSYLQSAIMLAQGLQHKSIDDVAAELGLEARQLLALFNKAIRKLTKAMTGIMQRASRAKGMTPALAAAQRREAAARIEMKNTGGSMIEELEDEQAADGAAVSSELQERQRKMFEQSTSSLDLSKYAIDASTRAALEASATSSVPATVSVPKAAKKRKRDGERSNGGGGGGGGGGARQKSGERKKKKQPSSGGGGGAAAAAVAAASTGDKKMKKKKKKKKKKKTKE